MTLLYVFLGILLGYFHVHWGWCFLAALIGVIAYYRHKKIDVFEQDLRTLGVYRLLAVVYATQCLTTFAFYVLGMGMAYVITSVLGVLLSTRG